MNKIKQILQLHFEGGLRERAVSRAVDVSRPTVHGYIQSFENCGKSWDEIKDLSDEEIGLLLSLKRIHIGKRLQHLHLQFEETTHELGKKGMTRKLLWEEYAQANSEHYGYSQYCEHLTAWLKTKIEVRCIIDHEPGQETFFDFSGLKAFYTRLDDAQKVKVEIFVAILGHSQYTFACAIPTQNQTDTNSACVDALEYFGGASAIAVPDNMKTAVTKTDRYEPILNKAFEEMARHYGMVVVPARPAKPRDKALVENAVLNIQRRVLMPLRKRAFQSLSELNAAIREQLEAYNSKHFQKLKVSRKDLWERIERPALKPLPIHRHEYRNILNVHVPNNYHVEIREDAHRYSVPHRYAGMPVKVVYTAVTVEIYRENERIAFHFRDRTPGKVTTLPEHRPENHRIFTPATIEKLEGRARDLGVHVASMVHEIFRTAEHLFKAQRSVMGVLGLSKKYEMLRLDTACRLALSGGSISYRRVKEILEKEIDLVFLNDDAMQKKLPLHENTRGAHAYA
jgi:transposase